MNAELEAVAEDKFGGGASIELDNFGLSKFSTHNNNTIDFPMSRHLCLMIIKILKISFIGSYTKVNKILQCRFFRNEILNILGKPAKHIEFWRAKNGT